MMRILQISNKPPVPATDGGCLAMNSITSGLLDEGHHVRVLSIATKKHPFQPEKIDAAYKSATQIEAVFVDTRVKFLPALFNLFSSSSLNISRFYSRDFNEKLRAVLERDTFNIIQLESLYMTPYIKTIRRFSTAKIVLRAHNAEYLLWKRRAAGEKNFFLQKWFMLLSRKLERYETEILGEADGIVPITGDDAAVFTRLLAGRNIPVHTTPFSIDVKNDEVPKGRKDVFHIGAMDWAPNREGVKWLVEKVWPLVLQEVPAAKLFLAGKHLQKNDPEFSGKNIFVEGEVNDATAFFRQHLVMTIPLFSGGGMRVKLIEGMASGNAIVTTPVGAEGVALENGKQALLAATPETFAAAICRFLRDETFAEATGKAAAQLAKEAYDRRVVTEKLSEFYALLLNP